MHVCEEYLNQQHTIVFYSRMGFHFIRDDSKKDIFFNFIFFFNILGEVQWNFIETGLVTNNQVLTNSDGDLSE